jgi:hypothetical protein
MKKKKLENLKTRTEYQTMKIMNMNCNYELKMQKAKGIKENLEMSRTIFTTMYYILFFYSHNDIVTILI